jgi:hypothetical protein
MTNQNPEQIARDLIYTALIKDYIGQTDPRPYERMACL